MIKKVISTILILSSIHIQALEVVDKYIEDENIKRSINRLYYLAKDIRNFTCTETYQSCITPKDILDRLRIIKGKSQSKIELQIINRFLNEREIQENIFMTSYSLFTAKKYFEAIKQFEIILESYPNNVYALKLRAKSSLFTTNFLIAEDSYQKLIQIQPHQSNTYFKLTALYIKEKRYKIAENILELAKSRFPNDLRTPLYQEKIDDSKSFWKSMFISDEVDEDSYEVVKNDSPKIEVEEKSLEKVKQRAGFYGLFELNRLVDNSILNLRIDRFLIDEYIYGVDELSPKERNNIYIQPNLNLIYGLNFFDSFDMNFRMNYNYRFYFESKNTNYGVLSPIFSLKSKDEKYIFDLIFSQIQVEQDSIYSYGFGTTVNIFNTDFKFTYKINSFSNSNLDRDTATFSTEHKFKFEENSILKVKYLLVANSILTESKIPYIVTGQVQQFDENITQIGDSNLSQYMVSSLYPTSYLSNEISVNYLTKIFSHIFFETGLAFEYRAFDVERADMKIDLFTLFEYQISRANHFAAYFRRVDNISDEDGKEFDEKIVGLNYKFIF